MKKQVISSTSEITSTNLTKWLQLFDPIKQELLQLDQVYNAKDEINKGTQKCDNGRPNNKIHSDLASMIVKNSANYFMGKNVSYSFKDENMETALDQYLFDSREEQENKRLAKCLSKYGIAYELCGVDEHKDPYVTMLDPLNTFEVILDDVNETRVCVVSYINYTVLNTSENRVKGWIYTNDQIYSFDGSSITDNFTLTQEINPYKPLCPVIVYKNNDECKGDYEDVLELLNAYNRLLSNSFDDIEGILNAVFVIYNATLSDEEGKRLNKTRVLQLLGENAKAEFLSKSLDENYISMIRQWIREDIFTITNVPDFTDEKFAGNQSGVALSYKLIGFENLRQEKAGYFKSGLLDRIDVLLNFKNLTDKPVWLLEKDVDIQFYANLPANLAKDKEIAELMTMGAISKETAVENMDLVKDAKEEMKRIESELPEVDLDEEE